MTELIPIPRMRARYTPEQLTFLRKHLPEYERRNTTFKRGEAKKYAHETALEYIAEFGLPGELQGSEEAESRLKEQVYNWYKNTTKRTRRKAEDEFLSAFRITPTSQVYVDVSGVSIPGPIAGPSTHIMPMDTSPESISQAIPIPSSAPNSSMPETPQVQSSTLPNPVVNSLSDVFKSHEMTDAATLSSYIQAHARARGGPTPLCSVIDTLFETIHYLMRNRTATTDYVIINTNTEPCYILLKRFKDAIALFPNAVMHAGLSGSAAATKALEMKLRKAAIWIPTVSATACGGKKEGADSMADELARINTDRKRRGDFMVDSFIHSAAIELCLLTREGRWFSESMARDAMWESDESEWLAGAIILRGFIRCKPLENPKKLEYERWLRAYEARWREFRDEHRQAMMADILMGAKQDISAE